MSRSPKPPLTNGTPELLHDGADAAFREFVADLFAASAAMQSVRRAVARRLGLRGSELAVLLAVSRLSPGGPVGVITVAGHLHVAASNITAEVNALVQAGLLAKMPREDDNRAVSITLTAAGQAMMKQAAPLLREVNSHLFGRLSRGSMAELRRVFSAVLAGAPAALASLEEPASAGR